MSGQDTPDHILIDVDSKGFIDLLSDPWTAKSRIASFQFDDGLNEFGAGALWARFGFGAVGIQLSVFSLLEQLVEFQECRRPNNDGSTLNAPWIEKQ